jgi:tRNA nucleotidyltransferase/poly(A) polymerase
MIQPDEQRRFALDVVRRLRGAGFEAYWAGGCVRDQLLGRTPKDYDVATNAAPPQIRQLFGRRRTLAIGAAFGVITVIGPKPAGTVEVATFRRDAAYSDGRHPDSVTFSSAEEDASRRDFTINGLFFDPVQQRVIDFVGGQADLAERRIRAIGDPRQRFAEDKLRMLRAVRFAATFDFTLDEEARTAIRQMAAEIRVVSPERIAMEMRRMLVDPRRAAAVRMMLDTGLAAVVLPEIVPHDEPQRERFEHGLEVMSRLKGPGFPLALAALLLPWIVPARAVTVCERWRLSNKETDRTVWLATHHAALEHCRTMRWSALQPILIAEGIGDLLALAEAVSPAGAEATAYCRTLLAQPREALDPPPLVTGDDLLTLGIRPGPRYKILLQQIRDGQLDGEIHTKDEALALAEEGRGTGQSE